MDDDEEDYLSSISDEDYYGGWWAYESSDNDDVADAEEGYVTAEKASEVDEDVLGRCIDEVFNSNWNGSPDDTGVAIEQFEVDPFSSQGDGEARDEVGTPGGGHAVVHWPDRRYRGDMQ